MFEVVALVTYKAGADTECPGEDVLDSFGLDSCLDRFERAIGIPFEQSVLDLQILLPTEASWNAGDRSIDCIAMRVDGGPLDRDVLGSGI